MRPAGGAAETGTCCLRRPARRRRTVHVPAPGGWGPFGAKMAGELSNSGVAPAIVNAIGPIRQVVQADAGAARRYLVIAPGMAGAPGAAAQVQQ